MTLKKKRGMQEQKIEPRNEKHVFVCVNDRGPEKECCKNVKGMEIFFELKKFVLENGLAGRVYVTKTGCLGFCNSNGANVVVYPERKWFLETKLEELDKVKEVIR